MNCGDDSRHKAEPAPQANLPAIVLPLVVEHCEYDHNDNNSTKPYELLFISSGDPVPKCAEKGIYV